MFIVVGKWHTPNSVFVSRMHSGHALIRYTNLGSAVYAKEKLNGFEFPPGNRLAVTYVEDGEDRSRYSTMSNCTVKSG